jgi:sigma-B regulation protein RsbU (phosphoserine phosphatase)
LNRRFQSEGDSYFTILYGIYEIPSRQLTFCQAGHPSPLILTRAGTVRQIGSGGFPVGLVPDMDYEEQIVTLAPGDRVILHSDGITECVNNQQQRYGEERLSGLLIRCAGEPIPKLVELVRSEILDWSGTADLSDDLSMLVLETH